MFDRLWLAGCWPRVDWWSSILMLRTPVNNCRSTSTCSCTGRSTVVRAAYNTVDLPVQLHVQVHLRVKETQPTRPWHSNKSNKCECKIVLLFWIRIRIKDFYSIRYSNIILFMYSPARRGDTRTLNQKVITESTKWSLNQQSNRVINKMINKVIKWSTRIGRSMIYF